MVESGATLRPALIEENHMLAKRPLDIAANEHLETDRPIARLEIKEGEEGVCITLHFQKILDHEATICAPITHEAVEELRDRLCG